MKTQRWILFLMMIVTLATLATVARAQLLPATPDDPVQQMYTQDPEQEASKSGHYYYCAAKGSWGGRCRACVSVNGVNICGDSQYSAKCECTGACTSQYGTCTYQP